MLGGEAGEVTGADHVGWGTVRALVFLSEMEPLEGLEQKTDMICLRCVNRIIMAAMSRTTGG